MWQVGAKFALGCTGFRVWGLGLRFRVSGSIPAGPLLSGF